MGDQLQLEIVAKLVDQVSANAGGITGSFKSMFGAVFAGLGVFNLASQAISGFEGFIKDSVAAANEQQAALAQQNAVLQSTHGAAGMTADALDQLSESMQKQTTFSHEQVMGMDDLLLTFTSIHKDTFPQVTKTTLDVATAMHEDLKSAAIQVGKALQDPATGMAQLHRLGVNFTKQQIEQAKQMESTGNMAGAQALIMKELNTEFGGSASAQATTYGGKMAQLKNNMDDLKQSFGLTLEKGFMPLVSALVSFVMSDKFQSWLKNVIDTVEKLFKTLWDMLKPSFEALWNTIKKDLLPAIGKLWQDLQPFLPFLGAMLVTAIYLMVNALNIAIRVFSDVVNWISNVIHWIQSLSSWIGMVFYQIGPTIAKAFGGLYNIITLPFRMAFDAVATIWNNTIGKLDLHIPGWVPGIGGKGFSFPKIPLMAEGGIVSSPTLAMIGEGREPEAVVPLSKLGNMINGGGHGGRVTHIYGNVILGDDSAVQEFFKKIDGDTMLSTRGLTPVRGMI